MSNWQDVSGCSWEFGKECIVGKGKGIGPYQISYAINLDNPSILNGKISADIMVANRYRTGSGLICRANKYYNFLAFFTTPNTKGNSSSASIGMLKQGCFYQLAESNGDVYLDNGFNRFSLEFYSGNIRAEIKTKKEIYEIKGVYPNIPFPGYVGLIRLYSANVVVRDIKISVTSMPFGKKFLGKAPSSQFDVFICHSSKDKMEIDKVIKHFIDNDISYWIDSEQVKPGDFISQKIEEGLKNSKYIMPCLSGNIKSGWTQIEYNSLLAKEIKDRSLRVIPLKLDNCREEDIPLLLLDKRWISYSNKTEFSEFLKFLKL